MGVSAYTMIRMADGSDKRAEDVAKGDAVFDPHSGGSVQLGRVLNSPGVGMFTLMDDQNNRLDATGDQRILTAAGFVQVDSIRAGTLLKTGNGIVRCQEVFQLPGDFMVYDFATDSDEPCIYANTFIIGVSRVRR